MRAFASLTNRRFALGDGNPLMVALLATVTHYRDWYTRHNIRHRFSKGQLRAKSERADDRQVSRCTSKSDYLSLTAATNLQALQ